MPSFLELVATRRRSASEGGPPTSVRHLETAVVMGILNMTPDSFSDGGQFLDEDAALAHAERLVTEGADVIDVGAESTRPGAASVDAEEQLRRIGPIIRTLSSRGVLVSIDSTDPDVADQACRDGAVLINSVSPEPADSLARVAIKHDASLCLMHCRGSMRNMKGFSHYPAGAYDDVVSEVCRELLDAADRAKSAGLPGDRLLLDPGFGFAKNAHQSLQLCQQLREVVALGYPVLVGASRKSFLAHAIRQSQEELAAAGDRLGASIAAAVHCAQLGAKVLRVHDVGPTLQALRLANALAAVAPLNTRGSDAHA